MAGGLLFVTCHGVVLIHNICRYFLVCPGKSWVSICKYASVVLSMCYYSIFSSYSKLSIYIYLSIYTYIYIYSVIKWPKIKSLLCFSLFMGKYFCRQGKSCDPQKLYLTLKVLMTASTGYQPKVNPRGEVEGEQQVILKLPVAVKTTPQ